MEQQNPHTLYYFFRERFVLPAREWLYRVTRLALTVFILALVANFVFSYFFYTPKMHRLRQQNEEMVRSYELLEQRIESSLAHIKELRERDHAVYRAIFSADTLNISGIFTPYSADRYASVGYGRYAPLMTRAWQKLDALGRQIYLQSLSLDQIEKLAVDKDLMAEVIPAIMPVDVRRIRGNIGSFGGRMHPILGYYHKHQGVDIGGPKGTAIYATGTGLVANTSKLNGYGNQVLIDHGFGYRTRYAHLSRVDVKVGQMVKRGEKIGEMGSTGRATGTHLHYEVIYRGQPVNPINYISRDMNEEDFKAIIESAKPTTYETGDL